MGPNACSMHCSKAATFDTNTVNGLNLAGVVIYMTFS